MIAFITKIIASNLFKILLPYVIGGVVVISLFFSGFYLGYNKAKSACKEQQYISQLEGEKKKNKNLKDQYDSSIKTTEELRKQNKVLQNNKDETIKYIYKNVPTKKECDINQETIDRINRVREGK